MDGRPARWPEGNQGGMSVRLKRLSIIFAVLVGLLLVAAAIPIVVVEAGCGRGAIPTPQAGLTDIQDAGYRRAEGDSFLTYPEWYIVHAYTDLAGVTRQSSESGYEYETAIAGFWTSLCRATETA